MEISRGALGAGWGGLANVTALLARQALYVVGPADVSTIVQGPYNELTARQLRRRPFLQN